MYEEKEKNIPVCNLRIRVHTFVPSRSRVMGIKCEATPIVIMLVKVVPLWWCAWFGRGGRHVVVLLWKVVVVVVGDRQPVCVYDCSYTCKGHDARGHGLVVECSGGGGGGIVSIALL